MITHATLTMEKNDMNYERKMFASLTNCKLWDIHVGANDFAWKRLLKSAKNLEKVYLWNIGKLITVWKNVKFTHT